MGVFTLAVVLASWVAVSGWLAPPVWVAGVALLAGAVIWWQKGSNVVQAGAVGVGAAWAWQPCVGEELGQVLNTAQTDPFAALPGLTGFMVGLVLVGLGLGAALGLIIRRFTDRNLNRPSAVTVGLFGVTMVVGIYPSVASVFARWSTALWT